MNTFLSSQVLFDIASPSRVPLAPFCGEVFVLHAAVRCAALPWYVASAHHHACQILAAAGFRPPVFRGVTTVHLLLPCSHRIICEHDNYHAT